MQKIGILDVDSKIPNLALMKLSTYHKNRGDEVEGYLPILHRTYSKIYASKIFNFSDGSMLTDDMIKGGSGIDLKTNLPEEIKNQKPDYSLYDFEHSLGFTQRGCRFNCGFCVVPKKEGSPYEENTIEEIWEHRKSKFIILLDNDFFGNPSWDERVEEIKSFGLKVNFSQGLNIRIISEKQATALASINFTNLKNTFKQVTFAWDQIQDERVIERGFKRCVQAGIKPYRMQFFVLIGYKTTPEEDMHRVRLLDSWGADPFVMAFDRSDPYQKRFQRWVNHKALFKTVEFKDYLKPTKKEQLEIDNSNQLEMFA